MARTVRVVRTPTGRRVAPGGWRRAVLGLLVGVAAGVLAAVDMRDRRP